MLKCMPSIAQLLRAQRLTLGQACSAIQSNNFASSSSDEDNHPGSSFSHVYWTRLELKHSSIYLFVHADRIHWRFTPRLSQTITLDQPGMVVCMYSECLYLGEVCSLDSSVNGTVLMARDTTSTHGSHHGSRIFIYMRHWHWTRSRRFTVDMSASASFVCLLSFKRNTTSAESSVPKTSNLTDKMQVLIRRWSLMPSRQQEFRSHHIKSHPFRSPCDGL